MPHITLHDTPIYYEITGHGDPLLLIHGLGSSGRDWEPQVPHFAQHYQVITVDVRGHGQSGKPKGPYSVAQFAEDIAALLQRLALAPAHVVGISMGGMIGFQLAVNHPALIRTLTIVNSGPELVVRTWKDRLQVWQRFLIVRLLGMRKMGEVLSKRLLPQPEHAETRRIFVERWAENDPRAYRDAMSALVGWSVSDQIGTLTMPILIIAADHDYTPVAAKEAYITNLPTATLVVVPDSHHALPVEHPEVFNRVLDEFLEMSHTGSPPLRTKDYPHFG
jgi:3-oxoadipate enol-lactonase